MNQAIIQMVKGGVMDGSTVRMILLRDVSVSLVYLVMKIQTFQMVLEVLNTSCKLLNILKVS